MTSQRDVPTVPDNSLAAFVTSVLPEGEVKSEDACIGDGNSETKKQDTTSLLNVSWFVSILFSVYRTGFPLDLQNLGNLEKWEYTWKTWTYHEILKILINII